MSKDARRKLRDMGGIMASSPELIQAVQKFNNGGPIMPPAAGRTLPPAPLIVLEPRRPTPIGSQFTIEGPVGVEELLERSSLLDTTDEARAERGFGRSAYRSGLAGPVIDLPRNTSIVRPEEVSKEDLLKETQEAILKLEEKQPAPGIFRSSSEKLQAENLADKERRLRYQLASDPDIQRSREETVMAQPLVPQELSQEQIDKAMSLVKESPDLSFLNPEDEDATSAPDEKTTPAPDGDVTPPPGGGDDKPTKRDLRSRYNDQLALMQEIYGLEDKDEAQERAMSLAMIGLAIAAGQSPNALTNIAQGAMVGLQAMGERRDAARERERGLKTLALQTAIDQQAAEAEAEAEAAKMALEQRNRLELEEYKARLGAMYGGASGSRDARNIIDFTQNTYTEALKAASAMTAPDFDPDTETPHQYAMRQAQKAAESIGKMFPGYGGLTSLDALEAPTMPGANELTEEERALLGE